MTKTENQTKYKIYRPIEIYIKENTNKNDKNT